MLEISWRVLVVVVFLTGVMAPGEVLSRERPWHKKGDSASVLGPAESVQELLDAFVARDLHRIANLVPSRWRGELEKLVRGYVRGVDEVLFGRAAAVLDRAVVAGGRHREKVATAVGGATGLYTQQEVGEIFEKLEAFWASMKKAGLSTRRGYDDFSLLDATRDQGPLLIALVMSFLPSSQRTAVDGGFLALRGAKAEFVKTEKKEPYGDAVRIAVTVSGERSEELLVQVDGKWVTLAMAEGWDSWLKEAHEDLDEWKKETQAGRAGLEGKVTKLENAVSQFEKSGDLSEVLATMGMLPLTPQQPAEPGHGEGVKSPLEDGGKDGLLPPDERHLGPPDTRPMDYRDDLPRPDGGMR